MGEPAETAASTVLCLAAAHVVAERDRLSPALAHGDPAAKNELFRTTKLISDGTKAAAHLLEGPARRKLVAFAEVLAGDCDRLKNAPFFELVHAFLPADRTLGGMRRRACLGSQDSKTPPSKTACPDHRRRFGEVDPQPAWGVAPVDRAHGPQLRQPSGLCSGR